jgi:hypothetical protein
MEHDKMSLSSESALALIKTTNTMQSTIKLLDEEETGTTNYVASVVWLFFDKFGCAIT